MRFQSGARRDYLARLAPFAVVAVVELAVLTTLVVVLAVGAVAAVLLGLVGLFACGLGSAIGRAVLACHQVDDKVVRLRAGSRLDWRVPRASIAAVSEARADAVSAIDRQGAGPRVVGERLIAVVGRAPLVEFSFADPVPLRLRGWSGWVRTAIVEVQDAARFVATIGAADSGSNRPPSPDSGSSAVDVIGTLAEFQTKRVVGEGEAGRAAAPLLAAQALTKRFGQAPVVDKVDLQVRAGELCVVMGGNGAGKSTLLRILAGVVAPTAGTIKVAGQPAASAPARGQVGYIPDRPALYERLTGREQLMFVAHCHQLDDADEMIELLLRHFRLQAVADAVISSYSLGMAKKIAIAAALLHQPAVLLADEPTVGLDARGDATLHGIVEQRCREGAATIIATHDLGLAETATTLVVLDDGHVRYTGTPADLASAADGDLRRGLLTVAT